MEQDIVTQFNEAIRRGDIDYVRHCIEHDCTAIDLNCGFVNAVNFGHIELVKLFLADPRVDPMAHGNEALIYALRYNRPDIMKLLLEVSKFEPVIYNEAFETMIELGFVELARLFIEDAQIAPVLDYNDSIGIAICEDRFHIVQMMLVGSYFDPAAGNNYAIRYAAKLGHLKIVKLLMKDPRVDPTASENYAFRHACKNGHVKTAKFLLTDPRINPNDAKIYAIRFAMISNRVKVVKLLLSKPEISQCVNGIGAIEIPLTHGMPKMLRVSLNHFKYMADIHVYINHVHLFALHNDDRMRAVKIMWEKRLIKYWWHVKEVLQIHAHVDVFTHII